MLGVTTVEVGLMHCSISFSNILEVGQKVDMGL